MRLLCAECYAYSDIAEEWAHFHYMIDPTGPDELNRLVERVLALWTEPPDTSSA